MAKDPRAEANAYLRAHGIKELFADLGARLMFERPKDPNAFLLAELERVQDDRKTTFFTDTDIQACFAALDPHDTGDRLSSGALESPRHHCSEDHAPPNPSRNRTSTGDIVYETSPMGIDISPWVAT